MLQVELANEHGLMVPVPTNYDLDELGNFPTIPVLPDLVSAGRSRGIRLNGIIQDYQQLEKKYKEDFKNIKANCQLKITLLSVTSGDHYGYIIDKAHPLMRTSDKDHTYYPNISLYACGEAPVTVNDCITALHAFDFEQAEKDGIKHIHVSPVLN